MRSPPGIETTTTTTLPAATTSTTIPACKVAEDRAQGDPAVDWATIVVDTERALPADYVPPDLVDVSKAGFTSGDKIRAIVVTDLDALRRGAVNHGTPLIIISAYRSYHYQTDLFAEQVEKVGADEAQRTSARAGHSEHQLGTTVDVADPASTDLRPEFGGTPTGRWLADHARDYGFVLSYPDGPAERTCYSYEPWHLRYVGRDLAAQIHGSGLTPREWMLGRQ
jgi:D-alanyl-D-alanine carboxypeptidase